MLDLKHPHVRATAGAGGARTAQSYPGSLQSNPLHLESRPGKDERRGGAGASNLGLQPQPELPGRRHPGQPQGPSWRKSALGAGGADTSSAKSSSSQRLLSAPAWHGPHDPLSGPSRAAACGQAVKACGPVPTSQGMRREHIRSQGHGSRGVGGDREVHLPNEDRQQLGSLYEVPCPSAL